MDSAGLLGTALHLMHVSSAAYTSLNSPAVGVFTSLIPASRFVLQLGNVNQNTNASLNADFLKTKLPFPSGFIAPPVSKESIFFYFVIHSTDLFN